MATKRRCKHHTSLRRNTPSFSESVIDLTVDSPVNQLAAVYTAGSFAGGGTGDSSTNQSVIVLDDTIDISTPARQERVKDCAAKKSSEEKSCKNTVAEALTCPVCLEELEFSNPPLEKQVMSTQCGHMFCHSCIVACLGKRKECPLCRKKQTIRDIHAIYV